MSQVQIISSNLVPPSKPTNKKRVELTPWDLQMLTIGLTQCGLLYRKPTESSIDNVIDHLKISLAHTLEFFPPLAGRLRMVKNNEDDTSSFYIDCNDVGALYVHAIAQHVTVNHIESPCVPKVLDSLFYFLHEYCFQGTSNKPLLAVQVSELADGFFIALTVNTLLLDASAFWLFFRSWAEISRGFDRISNVPIIDRWFPDDVSFPIHVPFNPEQYEETWYPPCEQRYFHFTKENIDALKKKANIEMGTNNISSLQALLAHVWRAVVQSRRLDPFQEVTFFLAINDRKRLQPSLSENYFGNAIRYEPLTIRAGKLVDFGIGWVALQFMTVVSRQNHIVARDFLKSWTADPTLLYFEHDKGEVNTNNAPVFEFYGNDFGWGKPVLARSGPEERCDGILKLFRGAEEGSVDIGIALLPESMDTLVIDEEFMKAVAQRPKVTSVAETKSVFTKSSL